MAGQRITNDHHFECNELSNKMVEHCSVFYADETENNVIFLILKVEGQAFYQKFFLDSGLGFWEEWDEADAFDGLDDLKQVNLAKNLNLVGERICSIACKGSFEVFSSIEFVFENLSLVLKFSDQKDIESDVILKVASLNPL